MRRMHARREAPGPRRTAPAVPRAGPTRAADAASALATGGTPLPAPLRSYFEPRFGRDLGHVRLHEGAGPARAAAAIGARAYTLGQDIALGAGAPRPDTAAGRRLLAHELAHVAQAGPADRVIRRDAGMTAEEEREAAVAEARAALAAMDEPEEIEMEPMYVGRGLMSLGPEAMCGPHGCFADEQIYADIDRSRAEDAAAERRAAAERKRRHDIRSHGTKQQKWELEWEDRYHRYKGVGSVAGTRDSGTLTPSGIRVPTYPGDYLSPRPFYESKSAGFLAWQGFIHYAEIVEAGQGPGALELALKTNGGFPIPDDRLNLAGYTKWVYRAKTTREAVEAAMLLASGLTAVQQLLARSAASTFARNFSRIAGQPATASGATMTVEGVYFGGVTVTRNGGQLFTSYDMVVNVGRAASQGRAMHTAFELGTIQAARAARATSARVGVSNVVNKTWEAHLKSQGYRWEFIDLGNNRATGFWTKVFNL